MKFPYEVKLPKGVRLVVELHDRPVDFKIIFPDAAGKPAANLVFSRVQSTKKSVKGTVTQSGPLVPQAGASRRGRKINKLQLSGDSSMSVEYADPSDPVMT